MIRVTIVNGDTGASYALDVSNDQRVDSVITTLGFRDITRIVDADGACVDFLTFLPKDRDSVTYTIYPGAKAFRERFRVKPDGNNNNNPGSTTTVFGELGIEAVILMYSAQFALACLLTGLCAGRFLDLYSFGGFVFTVLVFAPNVVLIVEIAERITRHLAPTNIPFCEWLRYAFLYKSVHRIQRVLRKRQQPTSNLTVLCALRQTHGNEAVAAVLLDQNSPQLLAHDALCESQLVLPERACRSFATCVTWLVIYAFSSGLWIFLWGGDIAAICGMLLVGAISLIPSLIPSLSPAALREQFYGALYTWQDPIELQ